MAALVLAGLLFGRRRRLQAEAADHARSFAAEPEAGPPAALPPLAPADPGEPAAPPSAAEPESQRIAADTAPPIKLEFEPRHLSRAMVNATLAYRLTLANRTDAPLQAIRIAGDMISAHASLSLHDQLRPAEALPTLHEVAALAPGESVELKGELRLPIASILPIRNGAGRCFVPLARFRVEGIGEAAAARVFVVGREGEPPGGALRPFALERGPGVERGLGQRALRQADATPSTPAAA